MLQPQLAIETRTLVVCEALEEALAGAVQETGDGPDGLHGVYVLLTPGLTVGIVRLDERVGVEAEVGDEVVELGEADVREGRDFLV